MSSAQVKMQRPGRIMTNGNPRDPLHGVTLEQIVTSGTSLRLGWAEQLYVRTWPH